MRIAGEEAVGIYMTAYPAFIFFLSLVQLGVPIAIAKVIAELDAKGQSVKTSFRYENRFLHHDFNRSCFHPCIYFVCPLFSRDSSW